jgi:hypothetical protein
MRGVRPLTSRNLQGLNTIAVRREAARRKKQAAARDKTTDLDPLFRIYHVFYEMYRVVCAAAHPKIGTLCIDKRIQETYSTATDFCRQAELEDRSPGVLLRRFVHTQMLNGASER